MPASPREDRSVVRRAVARAGSVVTFLYDCIVRAIDAIPSGPAGDDRVVQIQRFTPTQPIRWDAGPRDWVPERAALGRLAQSARRGRDAA
jgi:hypothetical protein